MLGLYLMWFAVAISGVGALGVALAYVWRPNERTLMLMRPLSLAAIFASIGSLTAALAYVAMGAAATAAWPPDSVQRLLRGLAETLTPVFVSFGFLAVAWVLVAIGMRRQA